MAERPVLVWFRQDLRLADNPALTAAVQSGGPVIPVFVLDDDTPGRWKPGAATRWWLHHGLRHLMDRLEEKGAPLILRRGESLATIIRLVEETDARAVFWNRVYDGPGIARDTRVKQALKDKRLEARSFNAGLLFEPWTVRTKQGGGYKVFTPFWRNCMTEQPPPDRPIPEPDSLPGAAEGRPDGDDLNSLELLPAHDWAGGLRACWTPGESGAMARLEAFLDDAIRDYADRADRPDMPGTSRLSPHLHFGEIGPRQVWHVTKARFGGDPPGGAEGFLRQIGWREFNHHLLYHAPEMPDEPLREQFRAFDWVEDDDAFRAWTRGETGYPIVDAGMRELWNTGWMHNRVRMIAGSFLVKDLRIPWQAGEAWFWDTLVDADMASNAANWQWVAGCGADAAPYFRIFNPTRQGERFDPDGRYVRHWVPEVAALNDRAIHAPWTSKENGGRSRDYPAPIVDHGRARKAALDAYQRITG